MQVHPSQISPGEPFDVFYFLRNHTDATQYYVQAKVHDVRTGELLATHSLTQSPVNARLFSKTIDSPPDPTGYGRNIVAIATVYTDTGFSVKSENYEEQEQYYLIKSQTPFVGGGGGIDARTARELFKEELKKALDALPKPEKLQVPDAPDMSFVDALFGALGAITREVGRIPKEGADMKPVMDKLLALSEELKARPQFERTDLSSIAEAVQSILSAASELEKAMKLGNAQLVQAQTSALSTLKSELVTEIGGKVEETIQGQEITLPFAMKISNPNKQKQETDPIAGVRSLMS